MAGFLTAYIIYKFYLRYKISCVHLRTAVPGIGGSQLEASLNRSRTLHWWCDKRYGWYTLWLSIEEFVAPQLVECWTDNIKYALSVC